ncbi:hypothetical protein RchiOBHm_Chr6g0311971 [Rosa chinensis]|uniref:Uncharacterized protein n=1 Tax=Rosa chinensis TaxID=74649 RepID=A0A2P6Q1I2_ROSCH|nr:hypothetical protein RchiOBHm_Chr6g0311971 [Rosa chinensis]
MTVSWVQVLTYTIGHCALSFCLDNYQLMFNCSYEFVKARFVFYFCSINFIGSLFECLFLILLICILQA